MQLPAHNYPANIPPPKSEALEPPQIAINLCPAFVTRSLLAAVLAMGIASTFVQWFFLVTGKKYSFGLVRLLNLDGEANFPTALSVFLLATAALLLVVVSWNERRTTVHTAHWTVLTVGFCYMTLDEFAKLHESLGEPIRKLLGTQPLGPFYFTWVIPASFGVAALGIYFLPFLRRLPKDTRFRFVLAGAVYLGGCIGVEMLGAMRYEQFGSKDSIYFSMVSLEELMEMTGVVLFIRALLLHLRDTTSELRFSVQFTNL